MSALGRFWLIFFFIICDIFLHFIPNSFLLAVRHCELYLIECWVLFYTSFLELCSAVLLNYSETVWPFQVLLLRLVRWDQSGYQLMAPYSPIWRVRILLSNLPWILVFMFSCLDGESRCYFWPVWTPGTVASSPFGCFFLPHGLGWVLLLACPDHYYLATFSRGIVCTSGQLSSPGTCLWLLAAFVPLDSQPAFTVGVHQAQAGSCTWSYPSAPPYPLRNCEIPLELYHTMDHYQTQVLPKIKLSLFKNLDLYPCFWLPTFSKLLLREPTASWKMS